MGGGGVWTGIPKAWGGIYVYEFMEFQRHGGVNMMYTPQK